MKLYHLFFTLAMTLTMLIMTAQPTSAQNTITKDAFGVNIHLAQRYDRAEWDEVMTLASEMGARWGREEFNWDVIEPISSVYSWDTYDAVVETYEEHDMQVLGLLTYSSTWSSTQPGGDDYQFYPPYLTVWSDYVTQVVTRYPQVTAWEIWNEPNHEGFLHGTTYQYAELFEVAAKAIRAANSEARIVLGGVSGADANYIDDVYTFLDNPDLVDVVAAHPYRQSGSNGNYTPEEATDGMNNLVSDMAGIKAVVLRHDDAHTPIWLTEVGWKTSSDGISEQQQAQYLMRLYTIALSIPDVKSVFWYTMVDPGIADEQYFGVLNAAYEPKPAYSAYQFVQQQLRGTTVRGDTLLNGKILHRFSTHRTWSFYGAECSEGTAAEKEGILHVHATFLSDNNCYGLVTLNLPMQKYARMLQFRAKGSNAETIMRVRIVDATGETFQYNFGMLPKEWMTYTLNVKEWISHWGGNNDQKLDRPLRFDSIVLDHQDAEAADMTLSVGDFVQTPVSHGYLGTFRRGNQPIYAYWKANTSRRFRLHIPPVNAVIRYAWQGEEKQLESENARYRLRAFPSIRFLRGE